VVSHWATSDVNPPQRLEVVKRLLKVEKRRVALNQIVE
jgi:hypothetical protein